MLTTGERHDKKPVWAEGERQSYYNTLIRASTELKGKTEHSPRPPPHRIDTVRSAEDGVPLAPTSSTQLSARLESEDALLQRSH